MPFQYKKVLVIGATSGIGEALADRLISEGHRVVVTGRRKENLDRFVERHGKENADSVVFDVTRIDQIPKILTDLTKQHPDIDCVVLNSGIQRRSDWSEPESIDMDTIQLEFTTNYLSYLALTKELIPFLSGRNTGTALIYISSNLALVPKPARSNYCATKAALHQWILSLRVSLKSTNIKVIEVLPPAVQTELHDERHQPDIKNGRQMGMPLASFIEETWEGLSSGRDQIPVGPSKQIFDGFELKRQEFFDQSLETEQGSK